MAIRGHKEHIKRLKALHSPAVQRRVGQALFVGAVEIQVEARRLITTGSVSGKGHIPSRPGEPPNSDTHLLDRSIEAVRTGPMKSQVESRAPYALALEKGTSRMAARPHMHPATEKKRGRVVELVHAVIEDAVRRG